MYDRILLPIDESAVESSLLYHAAELATWDDAEVELLYVADTTRDSLTIAEGDLIDVLVGEGEKIIEKGADVLDSLGVDYTTSVQQGTPAQTIIDYAEHEGHDLIAMPTHSHTGLSRYLLGSVTGKVVRLAPIPVLTAPIEADGFEFPYEGLLVPTDGSDMALRGARQGLDFAAELGASVHVLTVAVDSPIANASDVLDSEAEATQTAADVAIDAVVAAAKSRSIDDITTHIATGTPAEEILTYVEEADLDAVVMGSTGRHGIDRVLLGSVAEKTVRGADTPVITIGDN